MGKFAAKIFIDGGDPNETAQASQILEKNTGYPLDGQTTNPTLIARNLKSEVQAGKRLTQDMAIARYREIVKKMSATLPHGSVSVQVFADETTRAADMLAQARERKAWIPNASIKFPCTKQGLTAVETACKEMAVNVTLVFSQSQAAAVYEVTRDAKFPVFISPFVGRLDDKGENGMDVIANIRAMYRRGNGHVEVLTASVRTLDHILYALQVKSDIVTIPYKIFTQWAGSGFREPSTTYVYPRDNRTAIPMSPDITLGKSWQEYDLEHELTKKGVAAFWNDWNGLFR